MNTFLNYKITITWLVTINVYHVSLHFFCEMSLNVSLFCFVNQAREAYDGSGSTQILEPDDIADAILYAVTRPPYAAINELLIEPREAPI